MKKPNYHHHRYANFIADMQGAPVHIVGAVMLLTAHAWMRWNPEDCPFPFLPADDELLRRLCDYPRNWHRMRDAVLAKFICEDGKWFYPQHREDAERLAGHFERKDAQQKNRAAKKTTKKTAVMTQHDQLVAKQKAEEQREEKEQKAIKALNNKPSVPEPEPQSRWDEPPAPERGKLVTGLQGYRAVAPNGLDILLKHPTKLKEGECQMFDVSDAGVKQFTVKVFRHGIGFALKMPNGQILSADPL
jgi:uncharacterized protein YdaU (DUF1376 family)